MTKPQKYRDVIAVLRSMGWVLLRQGKGSHELWGKPDGSVSAVVPRHGEVSAGVIRQLTQKLGETPQQWR